MIIASRKFPRILKPRTVANAFASALLAIGRGPKELKGWEPNFNNSHARAIFGALELNVEDRDDRDRVLAVLLIALFACGDRPGCPRQNESAQLMADVGALRNGGHRKRSDREVCRILIEDSRGKFGGRYKGASPDALRHRVRELNRLSKALGSA